MCAGLWIFLRPWTNAHVALLERGLAMDVNPLFLIELLVFSGAALAWGVYEYWTVRPKKDQSSRSDDAGHPEG
jgi:hypothetical protein